MPSDPAMPFHVEARATRHTEGRWHHDGEDEEDRTPGIMGLVVVRDVDQVTGRMDETEVEREGEQGRQRQGRERDGDDLEGIAPPPLSSGPSRALSNAWDHQPDNRGGPRQHQWPADDIQCSGDSSLLDSAEQSNDVRHACRMEEQHGQKRCRCPHREGKSCVGARRHRGRRGRSAAPDRTMKTSSVGSGATNHPNSTAATIAR